MKKIFRIAVVFILSLGVTSVAFAQANGSGVATSSGSAAAQGGQATQVFAPVSNQAGTELAANTAVAPGLVASPKVCALSASSGLMLKDFGFALGKTYKDDDCQAIDYAVILWNQGLRGPAVAVLCSRPVIRYGIAVGGGIAYTRPDHVMVHRACPMSFDQWEAAGEPPLLDPITGQPYTAEQMNPPIQVAEVPLTPEQKKQADDVSAIEHRAAAMAASESGVSANPATPNASTASHPDSVKSVNRTTVASKSSNTN